MAMPDWAIPVHSRIEIHGPGERMDARVSNQGLPVTLTGWLVVIDLILAFGVVAFVIVLMVMRK